MGRSQIEDDIDEVSSVFVQHEARDLHFGDEPSRTRQEFAKECDINSLMSQYERTGIVSHVNSREPMYLDLGDGMYDLRTALDIVRDASLAFNSLPAVVRREFDNDPVKFIAFAEDPANLERMREWGLAPAAPAEPAPGRVEVVNFPLAEPLAKP